MGQASDFDDNNYDISRGQCCGKRKGYESFMASVAFLDLIDCQLPCEDGASIDTESAIALVTEASTSQLGNRELSVQKKK